MTINNLKDLEKLIKLCRKTGVQAITVDGISLQLGSLPVKASTSQSFMDMQLPTITIPQVNENTPITPPEPIKSDAPTEEELLFWSADSTENTVGAQ